MSTTSASVEVKASSHAVNYHARGEIRFVSGRRQPFSFGYVNGQALGVAGVLRIIINES